MNSVNQKLAILGAGPKACAIWAKHRVFKDEKIAVAPLSIIEKDNVGANWSGARGYTDGLQLLVSPSEQDLGFPYSHEVFGADLSTRLSERMFKYSWQNYLLSVGGYPEWVARDRPRAPHYQFRDYLDWVARASELTTVKQEIAQISIDSQQQWVLSDTETEVSSSGLVITGNGKPRLLKGQPAQHDRIFDGESFWRNRQKFSNLNFARIAVIGAGETAAAIACCILDHVGGNAAIELICKQYAYFTRAEVAKDLVYFSNPVSWQTLREGRRFSIMRRADRGVVSSSIKARLEESDLVEYTTAEAESVEVSTTNDELLLSLKYDGQVEKVPYQYVVVATGFDAMWFFDLFDAPAKLSLIAHLLTQLTTEQNKALETILGESATPEAWNTQLHRPQARRFLERSIERLIDTDLSVRNFRPKLHLPMMAGLSQGPGFPNLNCLGLMSDRILKSYLL